MTKRAWDGKTYDRIGTPQAEWGKVVLDRMQLRGDETVVDAGCGSGRVTELMKGLASLSVEEKKTLGASINVAKQDIEAALQDRRQALADAP